MKRYKLVIFDFDDTIGHLAVRWTDVKKELLDWAGRNGRRIDPSMHVVGISNTLSETPEGKKEVDRVFGKYESECVGKKAYLVFPSMMELMSDLEKAGYTLAIATGNHVKTVSDILEANGMRKTVAFIAGGDSVRFSKPDPETLEVIIRRLGIAKKEAIFIGNSEFDVVAGRDAGIETIKIRTLWEDDVAMLRELLL
jgi:phosphoglycolate phosphatase-like HAD superfamily hydrolase